ncbi:MAG: hypothetical protein ACM3JB_13225 [Acidobacteriaceae bacterium]
MSELAVFEGETIFGLRSLILENRYLRATVLPDAGAKIWQIIYKPLGAKLLWNNPSIPPSHHKLFAPYDDVWSGGWDELFPVDEAANINGADYPDHGELWTGSWDARRFEHPREVGVILKFLTPLSSIEIQKEIVLREDSCCLEFHHSFRNVCTKSFPFLWKLHPAFDVTPAHRIDFPPMQVILEPAFPGTLGGAPQSFQWPETTIEGRSVDLRSVSKPEERQLYFFYGTAMDDSWCAITNTANSLACGLRFDPAVFNSCWLFASYGGWQDYNVAVLEPCTGYPLNFDAMVRAHRHKTLDPGEVLRTNVIFTAQAGIKSVGSILPDGTIVESVPVRTPSGRVLQD